MMLASRYTKAIFSIVGILVVGVWGIVVFQVYDARGHGWNPIQYTSTGTSVTTLSIDDQFTVTNTCGTCYQGEITTFVTKKTVEVETFELHYHWWVLQYKRTISTKTEQRTRFDDGSCSNSSCPTNN